MFNILGYFLYKCNVGTGCLYFIKFGKFMRPFWIYLLKFAQGAEVASA